MTASPQFKQLSMFMTAGELRAKHPGDFSKLYDYSPEHVWNRKAEEASSGAPRWTRNVGGVDKNMVEYTKDHGPTVDEYPVRISPGGNTVVDGHHTVAAAADVDPNLILPVSHVSRGWGNNA